MALLAKSVLAFQTPSKVKPEAKDITQSKHNIFHTFRKALEPSEPLLTPSQSRAKAAFRVNWPKVWRSFKKFPTRIQMRSFRFKLLHNANQFYFNAPCPCGQAIKSFWHMSECQFLKPIRDCLHQSILKWFNFSIDFTRRSAYIIHRDIRAYTLNLISLWTLWCIRNKALYEQEKPSQRFALSLLKTELERNIVIQLNRLPKAEFIDAWSFNNRRNWPIIYSRTFHQVSFNWTAAL